MCEYFAICHQYSDQCDCNNCKNYVIFERETNDKFNEFLKALKRNNLLKYKPIQAIIVLAVEKLHSGINITDFDIQIPRDNPIWYDIGIFFNNQTTLNAYQDNTTEDKLQGVCNIIDYDINSILAEYDIKSALKGQVN